MQEQDLTHESMHTRIADRTFSASNGSEEFADSIDGLNAGQQDKLGWDETVDSQYSSAIAEAFSAEQIEFTAKDFYKDGCNDAKKRDR